MQMKSIGIFAALLVFSLHVEAATTSKKIKSQNTNKDEFDVVQDLNLPMAKGELEAEVSTEQARRERANAPKTALELGASSWTPANVATVSRLSTLSAYRSQMPALNLAIISPLNKNINSKFGVGFLAMQRTGTLAGSGVNTSQKQTAYITSLRLGAEYMPWTLGRFRPYVMGSLLPTMIVTSRSAFDDGINDTGLPLEAGIGTVIHVFKSLNLNLEAAEIFGKVKNSNLNGGALSAAVRVPI